MILHLVVDLIIWIVSDTFKSTFLKQPGKSNNDNRQKLFVDLIFDDENFSRQDENGHPCLWMVRPSFHLIVKRSGTY